MAASLPRQSCKTRKHRPIGILNVVLAVPWSPDTLTCSASDDLPGNGNLLSTMVPPFKKAILFLFLQFTISWSALLRYDKDFLPK